ncbi:hypothetical protein HUJ04_004051 [Dendroctonus ponderosae]|nr:hypothetical protein HUJ04_004051 [Dendroctonus ponderosae]
MHKRYYHIGNMRPCELIQPNPVDRFPLLRPNVFQAGACKSWHSENRLIIVSRSASDPYMLQLDLSVGTL